jgi:hypothetical protein
MAKSYMSLASGKEELEIPIDRVTNVEERITISAKLEARAVAQLCANKCHAIRSRAAEASGPEMLLVRQAAEGD